MSRGKKAIARHVRQMKRRGMTVKEWREQKRAKAFEKKLKGQFSTFSVVTDSSPVEARRAADYVRKTIRNGLNRLIGVPSDHDMAREAVKHHVANKMRSMHEQGVVSGYAVSTVGDSEIEVEFYSRADKIKIRVKLE